ncbi:MAG TPA: putative O-glycosylation ligase, exosortase A system-associated [Terracidiphilus sp.]|nr:putative O-glycosylation ligase, exosortase A system-associated [Terracidiphilus sp.]
MRDVLLLLIIVVGSLVALRRPWLGVLLWTWTSIMNPQALAWGFARDFRVAAVPAVATLVGLLITKERRTITNDLPVILLLLFITWMSLTLPLSFDVLGSADMFKKVLKIDFMILVSLMLIYNRRHMELLVGVLVFSIGFYGIKGGIFTLATGGDFRVWGPGGFIGGNNEVALAIVLVIPLMRFVQLQGSSFWLKQGMSAAMVLSAAAVLGSQSRGALLAAGAMAIYLWLKSPRKALFGFALLLVGGVLVAFMPVSWDQRMNSIADYQHDASAQGRINAWWMAWNLAKSHLAGGGFAIYTPDVFGAYAPNPNDLHAAHSIYFQVLGEHGFIGLLLFLALWWSVWRVAGWLIAQGGKNPETLWCKHLGAMCQVSLVGYFVGGAFLSLAYFDLPYDILLLVVVARRWLREYLVERTVSASVPGPQVRRRNFMGTAIMDLKP